jgi:hypothetical protein
VYKAFFADRGLKNAFFSLGAADEAECPLLGRMLA